MSLPITWSGKTLEACGANINGWVSMQFPVNPFRQRTADTVDLLQLLDAGLLDAFQSPKSCQEALAALATDALDLFQA